MHRYCQSGGGLVGRRHDDIVDGEGRGLGRGEGRTCTYLCGYT